MRIHLKIFKGIVFFSLLLIIPILIRCEKEKSVEREYPRLKGTEVTNVTDSGATFSADLYSIGTVEAIDYGFVWGASAEMEFSGCQKILLGKPQKTGVFIADVCTGLIKGSDYIVRPFVRTEEYIVYGPAEKFESLGSKAPEIFGFYPDSAGWGDTVRISGRNFSWLTGTNEVKLNDERCITVESTDTSLHFIVAPTITSLKNIISVELARNVGVFTSDTFRLIPPLIFDFQPRRAWWGDTIKITGKYLKYISYKADNLIKISGYTCPLTQYPSDSLIKIRIPFDVNVSSGNLSIYINGYSLNAADRFELLPPYYSITPASGTWGNTIMLTGRFNTISARNMVYFNNVQATISSVTGTTMYVKVPQTLSAIKSVIKYNVTPFNVVSADTFTLLPPVIKSFTPVSGPVGTSVTIKGKDFRNSATVVKFGTITAQITSINDSTIIAKVPAGISVPVKISITVFNQSVTSIIDFNVTVPKITGVSPLSGTFNDEITITGENFIPLTASTTVSFNGISATISRITESEIVVTLPVEMDSIPRSVNVTTGSITVTSVEKISLIPPIITSISPESPIPGQDITISGDNFNPSFSKNTVLWDNYPLLVKSSTPDQIIVTWPVSLTRGEFKIIVKTGGYTRKSPNTIEYKSGWRKVQFPQSIFWNSGMGLNYAGVSSVLNGQGYMMDMYDGKMISYNPNPDRFTHIGNHSQFAGKVHVSVVRNDTLFVIGANPGFQRYNSELNNWISLGTCPTQLTYGVGFAINNKIYFGIPYNLQTSKLDKGFWEYDFTSKLWKAKGDFPGFSSRYATTYFNIGASGYVIFADNIFCKYDPVTDTWLRLPSYPGPGTERFGRVSFVINNIAYVGIGRHTAGGGQSYDDFWAFDPGSNTWTYATSMPGGGRFNSISFVIDNKAYVGFGYMGSTRLLDFFEYDPNYLLK